MKNFNRFKFILVTAFVFIISNSFAQHRTPDFQFSLGEVKYFILETKGIAKAQNDTTFYNLYRVGKTKRIAKEIKSVVEKSTKETIVQGKYRVDENSISFFNTEDESVLSLREYVQDSKGLLSVKNKEMVPVAYPKMGMPPSVVEDVTEKNVSANQVFTSVDRVPEYPGGINALRQFLANNIEYPAEAVENGVNGIVIASFVVERDGYISDIKIDKKLGYGFDEEVIRVLRKSLKWTPGAVNGKVVRYRFRLPVSFDTGE